MKPLYELMNDFNQLFELIDSEDFDLDTLEDTLQAVEGAVEIKIENIARMIRNWESQATAMEVEEKRLKDSKQALENHITRMKNYVLDSMVLMSKDKIPTSIGNVYRQKNPPSIEVLELNLIPNDYIIIPQVEPKVDKKSILEYYKTHGETVPGTRAVQGYHLRIR